MNLNDYQSLASRTAASHGNELVNYGLGIAGESGEVADLIKKAMFHGHTIDIGEVKKELGDVLWYLANIARIAGLRLDEVAEANISKLQRRYPEGFSTEASINREEKNVIETENPTRKEMIDYLKVFGRVVPEYYEKLDDEKLKREYEETRKA